MAPGGWAFEFDNDHYPDIDDTALAARALLRVQLPESEERVKREAIDRGLRWILAMQNDNGGWAAFDRENNLKLLTHVPFADFITPLDPDSPDIVAHVLEFFGEIGYGGEELDRALRYLQAQQNSDGAWYGRWGVNYIYGTSLVLAADGRLTRRLPKSCARAPPPGSNRIRTPMAVGAKPVRPTTIPPAAGSGPEQPRKPDGHCWG